MNSKFKRRVLRLFQEQIWNLNRLSFARYENPLLCKLTAAWRSKGS